MTSVAQPSAGGGGGGGTGFLFGNIDKRGRLDEDYMDEDAKDAIDNVAPTVTDGDRNLKEITNALPGRRAPGAPEDDDYDDDESADANDGRVDYYNEQDELRDDGIDDDGERKRMADIALGPLAAKKPSADDDENYDDDDGEDAPAPAKPLIPSPVAPAPASTSGAPAASSGAASSSVPPLKSGSNAEDEALALQKQLISDAKSGRLVGNAELIDDSNLPPLKFTQIFAEPEKPLDMTKAKPRWYGVRLNKEEKPRMETVEDDNVALEKAMPVKGFDPVSYFLAQDRVNIAAAEADARAEAAGRGGCVRVEAMMHAQDEGGDGSDDELAGQPLDATAEPIVASGGKKALHVQLFSTLLGG